jgi:ubiquitin carboxyl-terminal hydrolase 47
VSVCVCVCVCVCLCACASSHTGDFVDKSATGYVGLSNQGATCYLNSLLQTLFMTPDFRTALYQWRYDPATHGDEARCLPRQLQRLFVRLQHSDRGTVRTHELTKSFGWDRDEVFVQHDVQEMHHMLFAALEDQCRQSPVESFIRNEHRGQFGDYVECKTVLSIIYSV